MLRSSLFAATSIFVLSACQPAADAPTDAVVAETPPAVTEEVVEAAVDDAETVEVAALEAESETMDHEADHDADEHEHDAEEHDGHDHDEDHDDHDHDEDHDEHDHDHDEGHDHDEHDHDDHDHAGGEAHVHGLTDMAVAIDGNSVSVSFDGALANFDLDESIRTLEDTSPYTDGMVTLVGGDCAQDDGIASIRPIGDHGNLMVDLTYSCAAIDGLEAIEVIAFERFTGFETVNAVILNEADQSASTLTAEADRIDLR